MPPRLHQDGDHLQYQQRREVSPAERIFISHLYMGILPSLHHTELGIQLSHHHLAPLSGLLGGDFWIFSAKSLAIL